MQSGVKPIVEYRQLREFAKFQQFLNESGKIVIIGYRINPDDNHINSLLHYFLTDPSKELIYLDYDETDETKSRDTVSRRLHLDV